MDSSLNLKQNWVSEQHRVYMPFNKRQDLTQMMRQIEKVIILLRQKMAETTEQWRQDVAEQNMDVRFYLAEHSARNVTSLRWRKSGKQQSYFVLIDAENNSPELEGLLPQHVEHVCQYEQWRLELNLAMKMRTDTLKVLNQYVDDRKALGAKKHALRKRVS